MKIKLSDIKDETSVLTFNEETPWVSQVITSHDERADNIVRPPGWRPKRRAVELQFSLNRVGDLYHVDVKLNSQLLLLCSLCGINFDFPLKIKSQFLFSQNAIYVNQGKNVGFEGHHDTLDENFEVTLLQTPEIDLSELLNEVMVLAIPMQPKPEKNEDDSCVKCGLMPDDLLKDQQDTDKSSPFAVLKDHFTKKS